MKHILSPAVTLFHADCIETMKALPDNSLDSCVCDPPYHLNSIVMRFGADDAAPSLSSAQRRFAETGGADRPPGSDQFGRLSKGFMGKRWDGGDIAFQIATWREVWRVLKPGGYVAAFGAPKNFGRLQCAILDAGFEERDCILNIVESDAALMGFIESLSESQADAFMNCVAQSQLSSAGFLAWTFGVGFPKGRDIGKDTGLSEWDGFNVAMKPAFEPIVLARKPLSEPTVAANVLKWRTGALNIDASRVPSAVGDAPVSWTSQRGGIWCTDAAAFAQLVTTGQGRWPANVVTDGSDEVVGAFPNTSSGGRNIAAGTVGAPGWREAEGRQGSVVRTSDYARGSDQGSAARFFYSAKASKADRNGSKHPTVKPIALMEWLIRLVTPPGGTVLDPFAGSGTTGIAAVNRGFRVVLCEREAEYVADIRARFPCGEVDIAPLVAGLERAARIRSRLQYASALPVPSAVHA